MDAKQDSHAAHLEHGDLYSVAWYDVHTQEKNAGGIDDEYFSNVSSASTGLSA